MAETDRRRTKQIEFNVRHGITPRSIVKAVGDVMEGARAVQEGLGSMPAPTTPRSLRSRRSSASRSSRPR